MGNCLKNALYIPHTFHIFGDAFQSIRIKHFEERIGQILINCVRLGVISDFVCRVRKSIIKMFLE